MPKNPEGHNVTVHEWSLVEIYKCVLKKLGRHLKKNTDYGKNLVTSILHNDKFLLSSERMEDAGELISLLSKRLYSRLISCFLT